MSTTKSRFMIEGPAGEEEVRHLPTPEAVLSKTITRALQAEGPGTWFVREYEDRLYRVTRRGGPGKSDILIEAMR